MNEFRLDALETPEGRAIYPFGAWGAGYLADAATERRLRGYLDRMLWVLMGFFTLQSVLRLVLRMPELVAIGATFVTFLAFHYAVVTAILHGSARASYRPTSDELLRLWLARGSRTAMAAALWCGLVTCTAIAIMLAIVTAGLERWLSEAASATSFLFLVVGLRRLRRITD